MQSAPRCHQISKFSTTVVDKKLNNNFSNEKTTCYPELHLFCKLFLIKKHVQSINTLLLLTNSANLASLAPDFS